MRAFDRAAARIPLMGERLLRLPREIKEQAGDIHLKSGQPVAVCGREGVFFLRESGAPTRALTEDLLRVSQAELEEIFAQLCGFSVFSHEQELRRGFLRLEGGVRVGVFGRALSENGAVASLREVHGLVVRVPREIRGCGDRLFLEGVDFARGLLLAGEPSSGKTTLLRDLALSLSSGKFQPVRRVAVVDQRGELAGFDLGPCADVLEGYPRAAGVDIALRTLAPDLLLCDELAPEDLPAVEQCVFAGVGVIASVHAAGEDLRRPLCRALLKTGAFAAVAVLAGRGRPGEIAALLPGDAPP